MRSKRLVSHPRSVLAFATLLVGCSQILGLSDGTDQGACETDAECAPSFECRESLCRTPCGSADECDTSSAGNGGGAGDATAGAPSASGDAGMFSFGGANTGGAPTETTGGAGEGQGGTATAGAGGVLGNLPIAGIGGVLFTQARRAQ